MKLSLRTVAHQNNANQKIFINMLFTGFSWSVLRKILPSFFKMALAFYKVLIPYIQDVGQR
jgi:hypothetical protein